MSAVLPKENVPVPMQSATTVLQVIQRAATDPNVDIDKMERLMAMHERLVAREAEAAWNDALHACQAQMRPIAANKDNSQTNSKYATYQALDRALRPIYSTHGFSISYDTDESPKPDHVRVLAYVSKGAHTRTYKIDMPADGKGAKGGDVMTKTHATGAANTYGKRYLLGDIFNVVIGPDTDGNEGMSDTAIVEWIKKINATTTKDKAKEVWAEGVKEARAAKDSYAAKKLRDALVAHGEFIDKAGQ